MAIDYTRMRLVAERLVEENGRTVSLIRTDRVTDTDPTKPWRGTDGTLEITANVTAVLVPFELEDFEGSLVQRGDMQAIVAAKSVSDDGVSNVEVETYDYLLDGLDRWKIMDAQSINPGGTRIVYMLQLRK
jgi:hypothetical protein